MVEGSLQCGSCHFTMPVEDSILDMRLERFRRTPPRDHGGHIAGPALPNERSRNAKAKQIQMDFFDRTCAEYEENVVNSKFYQALDQVTAVDWFQKTLTRKDLVLDVACGTGRMTVRLAAMGIRVVGIDISREMLILAHRKAQAANVDHLIDYVVGDAEAPPFRVDAFDSAFIYGSLHHFPDKQATLCGMGRTIKPGGHFYQLDPHASPLRFLFDLLMRVWHLYDEEADEDPLLTREQLAEWLHAAGIEPQFEYSTYLPAHAFHLMPASSRCAVLRITDAIFRRIPGIRKCAGIIVSKGTKISAPRAAA